MRHRERVMRAFRGEYPDRVGVFEQSIASSVATALLGREAFTGSTSLHYEEARAWMRGEAAHREFVQRAYEDVVAVVKRLDLDAIYQPWLGGGPPTRQIDEFTFLYGDESGDGWYCARYDPQSETYGVCAAARPLTVEDVARRMREQIASLAKAAPMTAEALGPTLLRALREERAEYAIPAGGAGLAIPMQAAWLEASVTERPLVEEWLDARTDRAIEYLRVCKREGVDYINGGGDFADNHGPIYSPRFYREVMSPRWQRILRVCRELDLPYVMRSDGNLWPVADELFGVVRPHGYGEIDANAGMDAARLRERFPELTLFGNLPCGQLLLTGTPDEVARATRALVAAAAPRLVVGSSNTLLPGTPVENIHAMFDTARAYSAERYAHRREGLRR